MTANSSNSYFSVLEKLVYNHNNTYHVSIGKKSIDADYSVLLEKFKSNNGDHKFRVCDRVIITKYKNYLVKVTLKIG